MSWAQRRKATYMSGILALFLLIILFFLISYFNKPETCTDKKQNQGEVGIDCGGPCTNLCRAEYSDPNVLWTRWSKVLGSGVYNLLAYIENPNIEAGAYDVPYRFKVYDKDNVLLFERSGKAYIPPSKNSAIFEDNIGINDKIPARISFEFSKNTVWQKMSGAELGISTLSKQLSKEDSKPRVDVVIKNKTLKPIENIEFIAVLYDVDDNAVAFSKTVLDVLGKDSTENITFTWPEPFSKKIYKTEIISKVLSR